MNEPMDQETFLANIRLERPFWSAEEFVATRVLQHIGASGPKALAHFKNCLKQMGVDIDYRGKWGAASFVLARSLEQSWCAFKPKVFGISEQGIGKSGLASPIVESPYYNPEDEHSIGPIFYMVRMKSDICTAVYPVRADHILDIPPPFKVLSGRTENDRVVAQELAAFMKMAKVSEYAEGLFI